MKRYVLSLILSMSVSVMASDTPLLTIPAGTPVRVRTTQAISSETAHIGDDVPLEVLSDVVVDGFVLIRQGTPVIGVISRAREAKTQGRGGHVALSLKYAQAVTGEHVMISGERSDKGNGKKAAMVTETVIATSITPLGLLFLFQKGNDSGIAPGTTFTVYVAADTRVDLEQLPAGSKLLRARREGAENLTSLGLVIDTNPANFYATITGVVPGGPGDRAGLRIGNLIATINRINTHNVRDVSDAIAALPADSNSVTVGYLFQTSHLGAC